MAEPFLSEIRIFSFSYPPQGWTFCNGQLLPINQNQALFALMGTTYGGNGQTNFALPDLRGRTPMHMGNSLTLGQRAGEVNHTLVVSELPQHTHQALGSSAVPNSNTPLNNSWASGTGFSPYGSPPTAVMDPTAVASIGGNQPHNNMSPYLALSFCIALQGIFPSRN